MRTEGRSGRDELGDRDLGRCASASSYSRDTIGAATNKPTELPLVTVLTPFSKTQDAETQIISLVQLVRQ